MSDQTQLGKNTWREALQVIQKAATFEGFVNFLTTSTPHGAPDENELSVLTTLYGPSVIFRGLFLTTILACIQETAGSGARSLA